MSVISTFCNCSMFCCTLLYVSSSFAIILIGKRELVALLKYVFLVSGDYCVVFPDHTHYFWALCDDFPTASRGQVLV